MRGVLHPLRLCGALVVHAAGHQPGCGQHLQPDGAQQDRCSCPDGGYGHLLHRAVQRQPVCGLCHPGLLVLCGGHGGCQRGSEDDPAPGGTGLPSVHPVPGVLLRGTKGQRGPDLAGAAHRHLHALPVEPEIHQDDPALLRNGGAPAGVAVHLCGAGGDLSAGGAVPLRQSGAGGYPGARPALQASGAL